MASHLAAKITSHIASHEPPCNTPVSQASVRLLQSRGGPSVIIDLSECDVQVKECTFSELHRHIENSIQPLMKPEVLS